MKLYWDIILTCIWVTWDTQNLSRGYVTFMKAMDLLHQAMCAIVPAHRHSHQGGQQSGHIFYHCFVCCCLGGHWGNTEQVAASWQCLVAFMKALDLLHQAMHAVLHRHTAMAVEMTSNGGTCVRCHRLFCLNQNVAKRLCYGPLKLTPSYYLNLICVITLFTLSYWPQPPTRTPFWPPLLPADRPEFD